MSGTLITKYRPADFEEMVGHEEVLSALRRAISEPTHPHSFLFTGPGGLGKTTLARIVGQHFDCELLEIDAASNSGVDPMRELVELGQHQALSGAGRRMVIIDECHTLSKNAWQVLLKITEEPPEHLFFALCTTEAGKVPDTIKQRSYQVSLRPLPSKRIYDLLTVIAELEGWEVNAEVMAAAVQAANGSPRKGINILQSVHGCDSRDEVKRIILLIDESDPVYRLCQHLAKGGTSWIVIKPLLDGMDDETIDSAVPVLQAYMSSAMRNAKTEKEARRFWQILDALTFPVNSYNPRAVFFSMVGKIIWS